MTLRLRLIASGIAALTALVSPVVHAQFAPPDPAELAMTSAPEAPGAPAIVLFKEQTAEDGLRMWSYYYRVKVLTEGGREEANVELPYIAGSLGFSIDSIVGRTIHPDGTVVPFTGKPYEKTIEKSHEYQVRAKVFTLPQVEVGSILEYRYKLRYDDSYYTPPDWYIQDHVYARKAHYIWKPTYLLTNGDMTESVHIAWTPILPESAKISQTAQQVSRSGSNNNQVTIELTMNQIPALPQEAFMPPVDSLGYRVLFYFTEANSVTQYWDKTGKSWSHDREKFIGPNAAVSAQAKSLVTPGDSQEKNLKKMYDLVQDVREHGFHAQPEHERGKGAGPEGRFQHGRHSAAQAGLRRAAD